MDWDSLSSAAEQIGNYSDVLENEIDDEDKEGALITISKIEKKLTEMKEDLGEMPDVPADVDEG